MCVNIVCVSISYVCQLLSYVCQYRLLVLYNTLTPYIFLYVQYSVILALLILAEISIGIAAGVKKNDVSFQFLLAILQMWTHRLLCAHH